MNSFASKRPETSSYLDSAVCDGFESVNEQTESSSDNGDRIGIVVNYAIIAIDGHSSEAVENGRQLISVADNYHSSQAEYIENHTTTTTTIASTTRPSGGDLIAITVTYLIYTFLVIFIIIVVVYNQHAFDNLILNQC